ncbi:ABC transporter substrate-binding protein [Pseudonocardia acaciae]|uniref:ABC transporter substrate-binding protein n=1 Tax=Pseudonocardia acaciae TaxID=551276 RepID=UPI00048DE039|nr:ABC transporter substrate-binding protein [Pseudonocardia acaciae]
MLGLATAVVLLAGCGAGGSGAPSGPAPGTAGGAGQLPTVSKDENLAKLVPADIAADGKIMIGTDASYPPNEYFDADGKTFIGMDVDMAKAVAAKLGLQTEFQNAAFGAILLGISSDKYEMGISSFTINAERTKSVDMVSYFNVGTKAAVAAGNPEKINLDDLCGKAVGVQNDTTQVEDLDARNKKCQAEGKPPIAVTSLQAQTDVTLALTAKRIVAMLADAPVVTYAIGQTGGQLEALGNQYLAAPYGIAVKKGRGEFAKAVQGAVQALINDGTYAKIVEKYKGTEGAVAKSEINPSTGQ